MLQNMVYLGHTVNLRYSTKSYKYKKRCERPKSEWLIFENTHEELVDQETWDIVQEVRSHKRRRTNMDEQNMFSGLVYCADCGKPMVLHRAHTMKRNRIISPAAPTRRTGQKCVALTISGKWH